MIAIPRGPYRIDMRNERELWRAELEARRYKFPGQRTYDVAQSMVSLTDYSMFVRTGSMACLDRAVNIAAHLMLSNSEWEKEFRRSREATTATVRACRRCLVRIGLIRRYGPNLDHYEFLPSFLDNPPQGTVERIVPRRTSPATASLA